MFGNQHNGASDNRRIAIQQFANWFPHRPAADVQSADDHQWTGE
jgi:hypothetical protein